MSFKEEANTMLRIYLCEDNQKQLDYFKNCISDVILIEDFDLHLETATPDPYQLLNSISVKTQDTGLYFLDIDLNNDINGLELARRIRQKDPRGFIVFVTTHAEMSYMTFTYKVEALDYIIKDEPKKVKKRIHNCIVNAYQKYNSPLNNIHKTFSFMIEEQEYCIPFDDIIYFETSITPHKIRLHQSNKILEFNGKLSNIVKELDDRFARVHRSFLINTNHIKEIDLKERIITMDNKENCLASAKQLKSLSRQM